MQSASNKCWGRQNQDAPTAGTTRDGGAVLTGTFSANQYAQGTVYVLDLTGTSFPEVELFVRRSITAHSNIGYEIAFSVLSDGSEYLLIVRWNGAQGNYTVISNDIAAGNGAVHGDVIRAEISGTTLTVKKNGVTVKTISVLTDRDGNPLAEIVSGNPGIGHNSEESGGTHNNQYGFSAFSAGDL